MRAHILASAAAGIGRPRNIPTPSGGGGGEGDTTFDALYDPGFELISDTTFYSRPTQSKPAKASSLATPGYTDQRFGTKIFRATDVADDPGGSSNLLRHEYSRKQAFNCDDTLFICTASGGYWTLHDASTFARLDGGRTIAPSAGALGTGSSGTFAGDCEATWHPTDPNKLWYTDQNGGLVWYEFDVTTKTRTTLFDLGPLLSAMGSPWNTAGRTSWMAEGRPSNDGRWWGLAVRTSAFGMIGLICYDRQTNTIVGSLATTNTPNNVSTSPLGNYVIPSWSNGSGLTMTTAAAANVNSTDGTRAYTRDFSSFVQLSYYGEHADTAIDMAGNEVYVSINYNVGSMPDVSDGYIYYRRMDNGVAYELVPGYTGTSYAVHMSGCAFDKPGWFPLGYYGGEPGSVWKDETIMAVSLETSGVKARRLAHHQTRYSDYFDEPHATVNRTFTRVLFASDFGTANRESHMVALPSWALD